MKEYFKTQKHHKKHHHKKHTRKKQLTPEKCSPKSNADDLDFTCYSKQSLHNLKQIWNMRHPDGRINSNEPREIWSELKKYMGEVCDKESCWLKQQCIKNDLPSDFFLDNFSPKQPKEWAKKPTTWLTSIEIEQLMKQYEKKHTHFRFLGPSPVDYDTHKWHNECVWEELCKFSLVDYKKRGINKIGIIFNLDPHYKEGSHWVALFINLKKKGIYYLDSYGDKMPRKIQKFTTNV